MENIEKFIGSWSDDSEHILIIKKNNNIEFMVDFFPRLESEPVLRKLLSRNELSINMKGSLIEHGLQVELGEEGLGPTLELKLVTVNNNEFLEPSVVMGLYDDYEDDFGVPWVFPLTYFKRIEKR